MACIGDQKGLVIGLLPCKVNTHCLFLSVVWRTLRDRKQFLLTFKLCYYYLKFEVLFSIEVYNYIISIIVEALISVNCYKYTSS